jgi:two-component system OmpR family sensor kinase
MDSDREQARRDLIADISHDLRTPLVAMRGYLELLVARGATLAPEDRQRYAEIALRQSDHLTSLIDDLFELAKLDWKGVVLDREAFAIAELASDVLQKFALASAARRVRMTVVAESGLPPVEGDLRLMERALENLIGNALRHTPDDGSVEVHLGRTADGVHVEVADTGRGIPADELPFVFDRHYRGAEARRGDGGGAGLGLAIARRVVELHGGALRVESQAAKGTRFVFDLPARRGAQAATTS